MISEIVGGVVRMTKVDPRFPRGINVQGKTLWSGKLALERPFFKIES
jgi:hypothetical protein